MMRRRTAVAVAAIATLGLAASGQAVADTVVEPTPSEVTALSAEQTGLTLRVAGAAVFGGQAPVMIADDPTGDGPLEPGTSSELGVDLTGATISQPDPDDPMLVFAWHVTNLPSTSSVPEAIRYTFPFKVGEKSFQPQAKLSNYASATLPDDPQGHLRTPEGFFQLRGNCGPVTVGPEETPITSCPHVAWLDGEFDVVADTIQIRVPIGAEFAPEITPGAVLEPETVAGTMITAAYQVVFSNTNTTDNAVWEIDSYTVPEKDVELAIAPAGLPPALVEFTATATLADDGSFTGELDLTGLSAGAYDIYAKACFADNCGLLSIPVTIQ